MQDEVLSENGAGVATWMLSLYCNGTAHATES